MKSHVFWQNFELGIELDIAGTFIYDGLNALHEMENFHYESEIFNLLYNISVGVERFLKVAIILIEFNEKTDIEGFEVFEGKLKTHNHSSLLARIKNSERINLSQVHHDFISLLNEFYDLYRYDRYDRYSLNTIQQLSKEKEALLSFLLKYEALDTNKRYLDQSIYSNTEKTKKIVGKTISKIILQIYDIIKRAATRKGIYTDEVRYDSKVGYLLMRKKFDFIDRDIMWKEVLVFILNTDKNSKFYEHIKNISPLDLDIALLGDYLQVFNKRTRDNVVLDEIEHWYAEGNIPFKERIENLSVIGDGDAWSYFYEDEDEDEDDAIY
ncbi:hypothetical protein INF40_02620 [Escherichia sp. DSM 109009]|uniref:hypothetical protein n=1 Tax=Enterobacteriaceae TaxID=543 RepID=UPI0011E74B85|nr:MULTISPECIES: hypothetical protein [Enterobacteriaceae]MBE5068582.1 hypothetical protein [Escherichia sp. DSM 109009]TXW15556.1 hypothetical protein D4M58_08490 [Klebsiella variicola]